MSELTAGVLATLIVLLGAPMGSFAALLAERLPKGQPVLLTRSRCNRCKTALGPRDLVPILSWLWLGGKCRHCGASIPRSLWTAELYGLALGVCAVLLAPDIWAAAAGAAFLWCLLALALADLRAFRLPDPLTGALVLAGLSVQMARQVPVIEAMLWGALGAVIGAGAFWLLRAGYAKLNSGREGLGMGDVKLMLGIGAATGPVALPLVTLLAALCGLAWAWCRTMRRGRAVARQTRVPFGAALACGAALIWMAEHGGWLTGIL